MPVLLISTTFQILKIIVKFLVSIDMPLVLQYVFVALLVNLMWQNSLKICFNVAYCYKCVVTFYSFVVFRVYSNPDLSTITCESSDYTVSATSITCRYLLYL